jgi:phage gp45-like
MGQNLKIRNIFRLLVGLGRVLKTDDSQPIQRLNCELFEGEASIPRIQNYGLSSNPPCDSHVVAVCSGQRKDLIALCVQAINRPHGLKPGDVVLYNEDIELRLTKDIAKFSTKKVEVSGVDLLQTFSDLVDFLLKQAPLKPKDRFLDTQKLIELKTKLKGNL